MNGNWGGIASRDFDRSRNGVGNQNHDGFGPDPSLDVINTIVSTLRSVFLGEIIGYNSMAYSNQCKKLIVHLGEIFRKWYQ